METQVMAKVLIISALLLFQYMVGVGVGNRLPLY